MSTSDESAARTRPGPVAVVTDSTTYLPPEMLERRQIAQVSLYVGWEGDLRPEREYEDLDSFYLRLRESPSLPTTSQPSVGDFLACYEPLVAGMAAALPYVDDFVAGHSFAAFEELAALLSGPGRPRA